MTTQMLDGHIAIVTGGTEKKTVFLKLKSFRIDRDSSAGAPWELSLAFEAPYDKDDDPTTLADFDGLTKSGIVSF